MGLIWIFIPDLATILVRNNCHEGSWIYRWNGGRIDASARSGKVISATRLPGPIDVRSSSKKTREKASGKKFAKLRRPSDSWISGGLLRVVLRFSFALGPFTFNTIVFFSFPSTPKIRRSIERNYRISLFFTFIFHPHFSATIHWSWFLKFANVHEFLAVYQILER